MTRRTLFTKGRRAVGLYLLCLQQNDLPLTQLIDWIELQMPLIIADGLDRCSYTYTHVQFIIIAQDFSSPIATHPLKVFILFRPLN
jgi:hypothetical protein